MKIKNAARIAIHTLPRALALLLPFGAGCSVETAAHPPREDVATSQGKLVGGTTSSWILGLGDSLTYGAHMLGDRTPPANITEGYVNEFAEMLNATPNIANYGCPGETSGSFLGLGPLGPCPYQAHGGPMHDSFAGSTQLDAAKAFLTKNYPWATILLSIGGNDLSPLLKGCPSSPNPGACFSTGVTTFAQNLQMILSGLRATAPSANIVVLTLYNPAPGNANIGNAVKSFNDVIKQQASVAGVGVAKVDEAFNMAGPALTLVSGDIHPTDYGYQLIADQVAAAAGSTPMVQIDCGSQAAGASQAAGVAPFAGDVLTTGTAINHANAIDLSAVTNPAPMAVYQSARIGNFTYTISGFTPGSSNTVRLHFAETYFSAAGKRVFDVKINDVTVLPNFDIYKAAGAKNKAIIEQFTLPADSSGAYVMEFETGVNNSLVSAIEVSSASTCREGLSCTTNGCTTAQTVCASGIPSCSCVPITVVGGQVVTTQGLQVSGVIAAVTDSNPNATPGSLAATIDWGDGSSSGGLVSAPASGPPGSFTVSGSHQYASVPTPFGKFLVSVTVRDLGSAASGKGLLAATVQQ